MSSPASGSADSVQPLNWGLKFVMLSGGVMVALALIGITPVLPQIEAELAQTDFEKMLIKLLMTIVGLSMVVGAPLAGYLVDRIGMKQVLLGCSLIYTLAGTAGLYLEGLPALFASRLLLGLTAAGIATTSMTLINTRLEGTERAKWMGAHVAVTMAVTIALHPLIGFVGEFGWRWPFALYSLGLPLALITAFGIKSTRPSRTLPMAARETERLISWFPFRYALLAVLIGTITYVPMVYVPFVIRDTGITSPSVISLVFLGDSIIGAVLAAYFGRSQRYLSSHAAFVISFGCTGIGLAIAALASSFAMVFVGMMVFGLGIGWFVPNLMTAASRNIIASRQGRVVGLVKSAHYAAAPLGVVLVEPISRLLGPQGGIMAAAVLALALAIVFALSMITGTARLSPAGDSAT